MGIRVWIEAGGEYSEVERVVEGEEGCVGFDDEDIDETSWRFTKRRRSSYDAALA